MARLVTWSPKAWRSGTGKSQCHCSGQAVERLVTPSLSGDTGGSQLLAHPVVSLCFHEPLLVFRREFRPVDRQCQLVELAGKPERHLVVLVVDRRAGVGADVEVLVPLQDQWQRAI